MDFLVSFIPQTGNYITYHSGQQQKTPYGVKDGSLVVQMTK